jgi:hypothetical protein
VTVASRGRRRGTATFSPRAPGPARGRGRQSAHEPLPPHRPGPHGHTRPRGGRVARPGQEAQAEAQRLRHLVHAPHRQAVAGAPALGLGQRQVPRALPAAPRRGVGLAAARRPSGAALSSRTGNRLTRMRYTTSVPPRRPSFIAVRGASEAAVGEGARQLLHTSVKRSCANLSARDAMRSCMTRDQRMYPTRWSSSAARISCARAGLTSPALMGSSQRGPAASLAP